MSFLDTTQLALEAAMSGSMLRQTLLTNDLANADTPGFQPQDVNFQQPLAHALAARAVPQLRSASSRTRHRRRRRRRQRRRRRADERRHRRERPALPGADRGRRRARADPRARDEHERDELLRRDQHRGERPDAPSAPRMDVTAENLANAQTTVGTERQPLPAPGGRAAGRQRQLRLDARERDGHAPQPTPGRRGGRRHRRRPDARPARLRPGQPEANKQGYVKMPNVSRSPR